MTKPLMFTFTYPSSTSKEVVSLTLPVTDIEMDGIDFADAPDFCDAFICHALINGRKATDRELDQLQDDADLVYSEVEKAIY